MLYSMEDLKDAHHSQTFLLVEKMNVYMIIILNYIREWRSSLTTPYKKDDTRGYIKVDTALPEEYEIMM